MPVAPTSRPAPRGAWPRIFGRCLSSWVALLWLVQPAGAPARTPFVPPAGTPIPPWAAPWLSSWAWVDDYGPLLRIIITDGRLHADLEGRTHPNGTWTGTVEGDAPTPGVAGGVFDHPRGWSWRATLTERQYDEEVHRLVNEFRRDPVRIARHKYGVLLDPTLWYPRAPLVWNARLAAHERRWARLLQENPDGEHTIWIGSPPVPYDSFEVLAYSDTALRFPGPDGLMSPFGAEVSGAMGNDERTPQGAYYYLYGFVRSVSHAAILHGPYDSLGAGWRQRSTYDPPPGQPRSRPGLIGFAALGRTFLLPDELPGWSWRADAPQLPSAWRHLDPWHFGYDPSQRDNPLPRLLAAPVPDFWADATILAERWARRSQVIGTARPPLSVPYRQTWVWSPWLGPIFLPTDLTDRPHWFYSWRLQRWVWIHRPHWDWDFGWQPHSSPDPNGSRYIAGNAYVWSERTSGAPAARMADLTEWSPQAQRWSARQVPSSPAEAGTWLFTADWGWCFTGPELWPFLWSDRDQRWLEWRPSATG